MRLSALAGATGQATTGGLLGWFFWIVNLMMATLNFFYQFSHSYGIAIILLTVAVRLLLMPIYVKQMQSIKKMQALAPKVKEIQERYKGDVQKQNQAVMQLYKDENVNLAAGCLPTLIQIPVLWALFDALERFPFVRASAFLWLPSLRKPDPFFILPILAGLTTYWQTRLATPQMGGDKTQQLITTLMMPAMIFYLSLRFPSGLSLYWVVSNLFVIGQQYLTVGRSTPGGVAPAPAKK